jgi:hypothetical protein
MGAIIRRRLLCAFAGLMLGSWLAPALAQGKVHRIVYISFRAGPSDLDDAFIEGLRALGYAPGRDILIEYRWAANDAVRLRAQADELVGMKVDLIVTASTPGGSPGNARHQHDAHRDCGRCGSPGHWFGHQPRAPGRQRDGLVTSSARCLRKEAASSP